MTKADGMFSQLIRSLGYCELRGKDSIRCGGALQCMHIVTRGNHTLRYHRLNAMCGCQGHHWYYTNNPEKFRDLVQTNFPERWAFVEAHRNDVVKVDYNEVINLMRLGLL